MGDAVTWILTMLFAILTGCLGLYAGKHQTEDIAVVLFGLSVIGLYYWGEFVGRKSHESSY